MLFYFIIIQNNKLRLMSQDKIWIHVTDQDGAYTTWEGEGLGGTAGGGMSSCNEPPVTQGTQVTNH